MKAIILAAGFATRLYPLTKNKAKPLLKIKEKPIIEHIIEKEKINEDILVISGDNLFNFSLKYPYEIFKKENKDLTIFYDVRNLEEAKRFGVALVENNLLADFEEKPQNPK